MQIFTIIKLQILTLGPDESLRFSKSKCEVLYLGQGNPHYKYKLRPEKVECSPVKKDLGEHVDGKLDMNQ